MSKKCSSEKYITLSIYKGTFFIWPEITKKTTQGSLLILQGFSIVQFKLQKKVENDMQNATAWECQSMSKKCSNEKYITLLMTLCIDRSNIHLALIIYNQIIRLRAVLYPDSTKMRQCI
jgi:hypothetical protein